MKDNTQKTLNLLKGDSAEKRLERKIINIKSKDSNTAKNRSTFNDIGFLSELSEKINETISNNESLFEILPDVELAMSFLISAILSPKDLMSCKLNFTLKNSFVTSPAASPIALSNTNPLVFTVAAAKASS